jgi:hypothetical protein
MERRSELFNTLSVHDVRNDCFDLGTIFVKPCMPVLKLRIVRHILDRFARDKYDYFAWRAHLKSLGPGSNSRRFVDDAISILRRRIDSRSEMSSGEGEARARLEIPLECERALLVPERDDDINAPRPAVRRVRTTAGIVCCKACVNVGGHTGVVTCRNRPTLEDVHETFGRSHVASNSKVAASQTPNERSPRT